MNRITSSVIFTGIFATLMFSAGCTTKLPDQAPLGSISATGSLIPADISLIRRGTHILLVNGKKAYFVESKTENLVDFEGQTVHILGRAEENSVKNELPILIVTTLTSVQGGTHTWEIPALDLRIAVPELWKASMQMSIVHFVLPSEEIPLLTVTLAGSGSMPMKAAAYYLTGHRALRSVSATGGTIDVFIQNRSSVLHLHLDTASQKSMQNVDDIKELERAFENALERLQFLSDSEKMTTLSGSGIPPPCGGPANIVCRAGYFCDVTDAEAKIGVCRRLPSR